jgi:hypothetical protein
MKIVSADITGSLIINGVDVTTNVVSSSIFSGSIAGRVTSLEQFSASLDATFATDASVSASILVLSQSVQASEAALSSSFTLTSGSYAEASASLSIRVTTNETNIATLTNASASFAVASGSLSTRVTNLESTSSIVSSSFATTSGSLSERVTIIEGQDATTGSNIFTGPQFINQASNAISFTSTASLYTDGGLRVSKDSYVSGTAYFNNVVVYGTSSIQYITSSQVNFGTNIITVNTDTPAVRFGGLAVFDSGSTQLTGSMLWDSEKNHWVYSNPSGSSYSGGMIMSGPRSSALGSEQGTLNNYVMKGQGGDHITSSQIIDDGTTVRIPGTLQITGSLSGSSAVFSSSVRTTDRYLWGTATNGTTGQIVTDNTNNYFDYLGTLFIRAASSSATRLTIAESGAATFVSSVTAGDLLSTSYGTARILVTSTTNSANSGFRLGAKDSAGTTKNAGLYYTAGTTTATTLLSLSADDNNLQFNVLANGNVGIGTSSPLAKATVRGGNLGNSVSMASTVFSVQANDQGIFMGSYNGTPNFGSWIQAGREAFDLQFNLVLQPSGGNVGIGTNSPDRPLDVFISGQTAIARVRGNTSNGAALTVANSENSQDTSIYSAGTSGFGIAGWANNAVIESSTGIVYSAYNGNHIFQSGVSGRTERMRITSGGTVQPGANGTQDLGTSSLRWATVFTSDLSMSNGIGDYTIVEGEEDLFLYNNKTNKVFKFLLAEVDPSIAPPKKS